MMQAWRFALAWLSPAMLVCLLAMFSPGIHATPAPLVRIVFGEEAIEDQCQSVAGNTLREAFTRAGVEMHCETLPWERAQMLVKAGERDAFLASQNAERASYAVASKEAVLRSRMVLFAASNHPKLAELRQIRTLAELKPFRVLSYRGDGWAKAHLLPLGIKVEWSEDPSTVLRKIASGRGDVFVQTDQDTLRLLRQLKLDQQITMLATPFGTVEHFLMVSKISPQLDLLPRFDAAIRAMRQDGTLQRLQQHP